MFLALIIIIDSTMARAMYKIEINNNSLIIMNTNNGVHINLYTYPRCIQNNLQEKTCISLYFMPTNL